MFRDAHLRFRNPASVFFSRVKYTAATPREADDNVTLVFVVVIVVVVVFLLLEDTLDDDEVSKFLPLAIAER